MKKFEAISRKEAQSMNTEEIRNNFLIDGIFVNDEIKYNYSYCDRIIVGGAMPVEKELSFDMAGEIGVEYFLERREIGFINIGGAGYITVDGEKFELNERDGIYVGQGNKEVKIGSTNKDNPMKLYFMSTSAMKHCKTVKIEFSQAKPLHLGDQASLNKRTIYQYVHPNVCESNQLLMGMTLLEPGNVWNTMPTHTHERRMETYFYFNMKEETRMFHMMGEPKETRHVIMKNEQAIISPSWSIHGGVATGEYAFIWAMAGENQTFSDMQAVPMEELK